MEPIAKNTQLKPGDILVNPKGKYYRIDTYNGNKTTFKILPYPSKGADENAPYLTMSVDSLNAKKWQKVDKKEVVLKTEETAASSKGEVDESEGLFIKEERVNAEESTE